jgi:multidrug resistance efflux pump
MQAVAGTAAARAQLVLALTGLRAARIKSEGDVEQAKQSLAQAQSGLTQADEGVSAAESQQQAEVVGAQVNVSKATLGVTQAKQAMQGLEKIAAVGGASVMDVAGAKSLYSSAKQDLRAAQAQLKALNAGYKSGLPFRVAHAIQLRRQARQGVDAATKGLRLAQQGAAVAEDAAQAQIAAARAGVAQARSGESSATAAAAMNEVVSPISGVVTSIAAHVGEIAQPGMALATVVATGNPGAEALAPARDLPRLHVGAVAHVIVAGFKPVRAVVSWISPVASPDGRDFRVKFSLVNAPSHLPPALGAEITVD